MLQDQLSQKCQTLETEKQQLLDKLNGNITAVEEQSKSTSVSLFLETVHETKEEEPKKKAKKNKKKKKTKKHKEADEEDTVPRVQPIAQDLNKESQLSETTTKPIERKSRLIDLSSDFESVPSSGPQPDLDPFNKSILENGGESIRALGGLPPINSKKPVGPSENSKPSGDATEAPRQLKFTKVEKRKLDQMKSLLESRYESFQEDADCISL